MKERRNSLVVMMWQLPQPVSRQPERERATTIPLYFSFISGLGVLHSEPIQLKSKPHSLRLVSLRFIHKEHNFRKAMATPTAYVSFSPLRHPLSSPRLLQLPRLPKLRPPTPGRLAFRTRAMGKDLLGDFGARDPFPAELESKFGDKVLGNVDTEHRILIPVASAFSLAEQDCSPVSPVQQPMSLDDAQKLLKKVVGWRLLEEESGLKLQCLWKLRDFKCGVELINRIYNVVEPTAHFPSLYLEPPNQVRAELWTSSVGGLSMNDFIIAAKIDRIKTSDLAPKKRVWA